MGHIEEKYIAQLKLQIAGLEKKFSLHAKHNATFDELKEILTSIRDIKDQIKKIEDNFI